jgi:ParB family chromosome partitioning protein
MPERRLGRGLDGIMSTMPGQPLPDVAPAQSQPLSVAVSALDPNPHQPRQGMQAEDLENLKASILEHGVLQPIIVRQHGDRYQVIAGERRFRAAQAAGLSDVPVVVREATDEEMLELALVENIQREDLDPIEKATSFKAYLDGYGKTQEAAAARLGIERSTLANFIRLLDLSGEIQAMVRSGLVSMGHARALLALDNPKRRRELAERIAREGLSVRQVERLVSSGPGGPRAGRAKAKKDVHARDLEARLRESLGTKVSVEEGAKPGTGRIVIEFYSPDDLERILARLG